jgi:hypothetical protein
LGSSAFSTSISPPWAGCCPTARSCSLTPTRSGTTRLSARFPERIVVLDGTLPAETIAEEVYGALRVRS